MQVELTDRERARQCEIERVRQPHVRKRLPHRHRRLEIVDVNQPLRRQEVEADIVERVLHDLMRLRLDPERDERDLVHQPLELGVVRVILVGGGLLGAAAVGAGTALG